MLEAHGLGEGAGRDEAVGELRAPAPIMTALSDFTMPERATTTADATDYAACSGDEEGESSGEESGEEFAASLHHTMNDPSQAAALALAPLRPPPPPKPPEGPEEFRVRLTLTVSRSTAGVAPGLDIADCGRCIFCLDKPRFGGRGTKRQKCVVKQAEAQPTAVVPVKAFAAMRVVSKAEMEEIEYYATMAPPPALTAAIEKGPLPVVWAFRRKRRARTLPPAYVLLYHCEERVPLDRSHLAQSQQRFHRNNRHPPLPSAYGGAPRKPRPPKRSPAKHYDILNQQLQANLHANMGHQHGQRMMNGHTIQPHFVADPTHAAHALPDRSVHMPMGQNFRAQQISGSQSRAPGYQDEMQLGSFVDYAVEDDGGQQRVEEVHQCCHRTPQMFLFPSRRCSSV